jgi:uncharacterized protein (TIGR03437 family)
LKRLIALLIWCLLASCEVFCQGFSAEKISWPAGTGFVGNAENGITTAPDGRLWAVCNNGVVVGQKALGDDTLINAGSMPTLNGVRPIVYPRNIISDYTFSPGRTVAAIPGFSPQNGETITFAPIVLAQGSPSLYRDYEYQAGVNPAILRQVCVDYTINGKLSPATMVSAPSYSGSDMYYIGTENAGTPTAMSTMYLRGATSSKGICDLVSGVSLNGEVLQAWKQANGIVKETVVSVDPMNGILSEIGVQNPNGSTEVIVSARASSNGIFAQQCCNVVIDPANGNALTTYRTPGGNALVRFADGTVKKIYGDEDGLSNNYISAIALRGEWALMWKGTSSMILAVVNTTTGKVSTVTSSDLPAGAKITNAAITPYGEVYVVVSGQLYRLTLNGPPIFTKAEVEQPTITKGGSTQLTWCATNATTVSITGLGADAGTVIVPVCGSVVVSPTATWTYTLTAIGPLGSAQATVTVTVVPNPPQIQATTTIFGGTTALKAAPGQIVTLWGTLCSNVPADTQWLPLQTAVAGCRVKFADVQGQNVTLGNLYYVSAGQINVQVPETTTLGTAQMTVTFNGLSSAPEFFQVVSTNPDYVVETVGTQAYLKGVHLNGSYTTASNPAVGGETILVFLSGLGSGTKIAIDVNGIAATVYYAGPQGDYPGLDQINVQVPANVKYGTEYIVTATATDGTQKVDTLSTEPVLQ